MRPKGRVLIIAGSDSGGGAGIQGDIKTVTTLGGYASTAITALTAQNTQGVFGIHDIPIDFIRQQISLVMEDIGADAFKTGMLSTGAIIGAVAESISPYTDHTPFVLDPVMFAKGGAALLQPDAIDLLKSKLVPMARIITPNIPEAEHLAGMKIHDVEGMKQAARKILELGCGAVLVKGGHMEGETVTDLLLSQDQFELFTSAHLHTKHTHGTGCTLASAIAAGLAQGMTLPESVRRARHYVRKAMEMAPGLGKGHGPLGHHLTVQPFTD